MDILHLLSSSLFSGALPPTLALALAQRQAGAKIYCMVDTWRKPWNPYEEPALPALAAHKLVPDDLQLSLSAKAPPWRQGQDWLRLRQWLATHRPAIVHVHLSHDHNLAVWAGMPKGVALVRTIHSERPLQRSWDRRWLLPACQGLLVRCQDHKQYLEQLYPGKVIGLLPSSLPQGHFQPATADQRLAARQTLALPADAWLVGMAALLQNRGQAQLIKTLPRLPKRCHAVFAGEGSDKATLVALAQQLGVAERVHFVGYLQGQAALQQFYHTLDMVLWLLPGNDAGVRPVLEAMACGLPVLARQHPLLEDFGLEQCGRLLPYDLDSELTLATGIMWLMGSPAEARRRGLVGADIVRYTRTSRGEAEASLAWYQLVQDRMTGTPGRKLTKKKTSPSHQVRHSAAPAQLQ